MSEIYSEPFASQSALGMAAVSLAVVHQAKVLLSGDGGDEFFLGYPFCRTAWIAERIAERTPPTLARDWQRVEPSLPRSGVLRRLNTLLNCSTQGLTGFVRARSSPNFYAERAMLRERTLGGAEVMGLFLRSNQRGICFRSCSCISGELISRANS